MEAVDLGGGRAVAVMMRGPIWGTEDGGATWTVWTEAFLARPRGDPDRARWAFAGAGGPPRTWGSTATGYHSAFDMRTTEPVVAVASEPAPPEASGVALRIEPNPASGAARCGSR